MHLVLYIRGVKSQTDLWISMAQGLHWKWRRVNKETGEDEIVLVQGGLRPSMLGSWEYIFPKESLPEVLCIMGVTNKKAGIYGTIRFKNARMNVLRKILGVKKIPNSIFKKAAALPDSIVIDDCERGLSHIKVPGVAVHVVGTKEDVMGEIYDSGHEHSHYQEML